MFLIRSIHFLKFFDKSHPQSFYKKFLTLKQKELIYIWFGPHGNLEKSLHYTSLGYGTYETNSQRRTYWTRLVLNFLAVNMT